MFRSVRNQLVLLFFVITAAAIGFVYLYVVPQLSSSLTAEKLRRLQEEAGEPGQELASGDRGRTLPAELRRLALRLSQRAGARVTVLGVGEGSTGLRPAFVVADSDDERSALAPSYPGGDRGADPGRRRARSSGSAARAWGDGSGAVGGGRAPWVVVLSDSLTDVDDNVALITRQILIAGAIALVAALAAGFFAARAHSRRLRRLDAAAERVAEGDFSTPIPVDSSTRWASWRRP